MGKQRYTLWVYWYLVTKFYQESPANGVIRYDRHDVERLLAKQAEGFSTRPTREGVLLVFDGNGLHTRSLPDDMQAYVRETDGAQFDDYRSDSSGKRGI